MLATSLHAGAWGDVFETAHFRHIAGGGLGDGGSALAASLLPRDIAAGPDGTLYVADEQSNRVRAISPDGTITTIVGSGRYGGDEGAIAPADASFSIPNSLASAPHSGALYIVDLGNCQVRRLADGFLQPFVTPDHPVFTTVAGTFAPAAIAIGPEGKIHIADRGTNVVWQFDPDGGGRRAAGNGTRGYAGDGGPSALGQLANPVSVDVGADGSIYVADRGNRRVRKVEEGQLSTIAGNGGLATAWEEAASALSVSLDPIDLAAAPGGDLFVLDALGNRLIRLSDDRLHVVCSFSEEAEPRAISIMPDGRVLVYEHGGGRVTILDPDPTAFDSAQPLAGNGLIRASGDGDVALNASLYQPFGLATDGQGTIYFADRLNHLVRRITSNGTIEIVAGTGEAGYGGDGGPPKEALFDHPTGLAIDVDGRVWVADEGNHRIRRIDLNENTIETVAGSGVAEFSGDFGSALAAGLRLPSGIALDAGGRLIIADAGNRRVRRVEADGTMVTIAGNGETFPATGGLALESALLRPVDVTRDDRGGLLITDAEGHRVYRLHDGLLLPVAGTVNGEEEGIDGTLATQAARAAYLSLTPAMAESAMSMGRGSSEPSSPMPSSRRESSSSKRHSSSPIS
jgi:sugar lactone lactonase YvrE